jgi:RNA polymerase sigma factor for flagellar operon FliA
MTTTSRREDLILTHLPQVELLARRLHRRCPQVELDDLISAGTIGLIQAVDRFHPSRNLKLKTLADHRIRGAMLDYLRQIDPLPRNARRFQKQRDAVMAEFAKVGEFPTREQVAHALGVPMRRFVRLSIMITASEMISPAEPP